MNDFKTVIQEAIDLIGSMEESTVVKIRGRVVKINLPLEVAKYMKTTLPPMTSKENKDGVMSWFVGIPCEIKKDIKNVQYVIEGDVIYENSED